jgi:hypothetical protein
MFTSPRRLALAEDCRAKLELIFSRAQLEGACENVDRLLRKIHQFTRMVPDEIYEFIEQNKAKLDAPGFIISGLPISYERPTPIRIFPKLNLANIEREEFLHLLLSSVVGQVFTFDTIQLGNVINHIIPIKEDAARPISSGFQNDFGFHTEDAYHPCAGDYLGLLAVRNPDAVPTTLAFLGDMALTPALRDPLFEPRFLIKPNVAHHLRHSSIARTSILFGAPEAPYVRANFNLFDPADHDPETMECIRQLQTCVASAKQAIALAPGELLFIDNLRTLHGRDKYVPKFDGSDRWLIRLYITTAWRQTARYRIHLGGYTLRGDVSHAA